MFFPRFLMTCPCCDFAVRMGKWVLGAALVVVPALAIASFGIGAPASTEGNGLQALNNQAYVNLNESRTHAPAARAAADGQEMAVYLANWQYTDGSVRRR